MFGDIPPIPHVPRIPFPVPVFLFSYIAHEIIVFLWVFKLFFDTCVRDMSIASEMREYFENLIKPMVTNE